MSRYVNADELIATCNIMATQEHADIWHQFSALVMWQQTADVEEVVRCKDCRFHENEQIGMVYCPAVVGGWVEDNWFCKGGEREDEVEE